MIRSRRSTTYKQKQDKAFTITGSLWGCSVLTRTRATMPTCMSTTNIKTMNLIIIINNSLTCWVMFLYGCHNHLRKEIIFIQLFYDIFKKNYFTIPFKTLSFTILFGTNPIERWRENEREHTESRWDSYPKKYCTNIVF